MLKGPSGTDLNKERADGFLEHTHTHRERERNGNGFALGVSRGQYDAGCKVKYFQIPSELLARKKTPLNLDLDSSHSPAGSSRWPHARNNMSMDLNEDKKV